jgi:UDPglucose--hexose-1-phosphate uridylyltransferase
LPEVRTDPIGGTRVVIADDRADRPGAFEAPNPKRELDSATDPFAEGNEHMTPPELWADRPDGGAADGRGWRVRVVPNLYPALTPESDEPDPNADPDLFGRKAATGNHEVVINSPRSVQSLADLDEAELALAMTAWQSRLAAHDGAACRHLFVNEGLQAGASLPHTHAQLVAFDFVPERIAREREAFTAHASRTAGANLLSDVLAAEVRMRDRVVHVDEEAVLIAPWASTSAWQLMIVPRAPHADFATASTNCSAMLHTALRALTAQFGNTPPLNLWVRTAPSGADHWCWRIDLLPRLAQPAGIELGTGLHVNPMSPERVATELKATLATL